MKSVLTKNQKKTFTKVYQENGDKYRITATVRHDDDCHNGHNSFSITGDIDQIHPNGRITEVSGGCIHQDIIKRFPELEKYIKWHLTSADGPMHYLANTMYHASNKDCWGKRKGEPRTYKNQLKFGEFPMPFDVEDKFLEFLQAEINNNFQFLKIIEIQHPPDTYNFSPNYSFNGYTDKWYKCPFDTKQEAMDFLKTLKKYPFKVIKTPTSFGEGKEPDLEAARSCAIWPDATLKQLTSKNQLLKRLPKLMREFRHDVKELGLIY